MSARITDAMVEIGARASATRHYAERFRAPADTPQVQANADANWYLFADEARTVLTAVLSIEPGEAEEMDLATFEIASLASGNKVLILDRDWWPSLPVGKYHLQAIPAAPRPEDTHHGR